MKNLKLQTKIILSTALLVPVLLAITLTVAITQYNSFNNFLLEQRLDVAANNVRELTDDLRRKVIDLAVQVAADPHMHLL